MLVERKQDEVWRSILFELLVELKNLLIVLLSMLTIPGLLSVVARYIQHRGARSNLCLPEGY